MRFSTKFKICLYKGYFEKGLSLTNYVKYLIAFFSLASQDIEAVLWMGGVYAILCFLIGWWWYRSDFIMAEIEVGNKFNKFVKEMRRKI